MPYNWDELEKNAGGNFAQMATAGTYSVKIDTVDVRENKNKSGGTTYWVDFLFQEDDFRYPKVSHPISFKNQGWRMVHFKRILEELGIAEDKARQAIEQAEGKKDNDNIVAAYHAILARATQKHPSVGISVYEDTKTNPNTGKPYMRADFASPKIGFGRDARPAKQESILDSGEEMDLNSDDGFAIPF